jgi:hypothetical protein
METKQKVAPSPPDDSPLRSVHTTNFPAILEQLGITLVVSTYQAHKLILVRADNGTLNTHFRAFKKPMGLAVDRARITVGTASEVWYLRNVPDVARKLEPPGKHDACYLPRKIHVTGDIDIHEMAWGREAQDLQSQRWSALRKSQPGSRRKPGPVTSNDQLWVVNTKFSCLCTLDDDHNFIPHWRPPFVTALFLEDRCHLNGLGLRNGQPKYVTMLGETDTPGGWRENKANGGLLMDVETNDILLRDLSMPHSPRWYNDQLWLLESGDGSIARVDLEAARLETVTQLPGFTRGLDFCGPLAFIGLSQVRETAVFSGIPLTERLEERICGVWVVNIQTGQTVAFLRFEGAVQEIFAVQVLPGIRFPEILEWGDERVAHSYVLPDEALADVPPEQRSPNPDRPATTGQESKS